MPDPEREYEIEFAIQVTVVYDLMSGDEFTDA